MVSSILASSPALAAGIGTILSGPVMEFFGRQKSLVFIAFPYIVGWSLIGFSSNIASIHAGRAFTGLSIGLSKAVAPIYVSFLRLKYIQQ
jgi:MFS family permease